MTLDFPEGKTGRIVFTRQHRNQLHGRGTELITLVLPLGAEYQRTAKVDAHRFVTVIEDDIVPVRPMTSQFASQASTAKPNFNWLFFASVSRSLGFPTISFEISAGLPLRDASSMSGTSIPAARYSLEASTSFRSLLADGLVFTYHLTPLGA